MKCDAAIPHYDPIPRNIQFGQTHLECSLVLRFGLEGRERERSFVDLLLDGERLSLNSYSARVLPGAGKIRNGR